MLDSLVYKSSLRPCTSTYISQYLDVTGPYRSVVCMLCETQTPSSRDNNRTGDSSLQTNGANTCNIETTTTSQQTTVTLLTNNCSTLNRVPIRLYILMYMYVPLYTSKVGVPPVVGVVCCYRTPVGQVS